MEGQIKLSPAEIRSISEGLREDGRRWRQGLSYNVFFWPLPPRPGWRVLRSGRKRARKILPTKQAAVAYAKKIADSAIEEIYVRKRRGDRTDVIVLRKK